MSYSNFRRYARDDRRYVITTNETFKRTAESLARTPRIRENKFHGPSFGSPFHLKGCADSIGLERR